MNNYKPKRKMAWRHGRRCVNALAEVLLKAILPSLIIAWMLLLSGCPSPTGGTDPLVPEAPQNFQAAPGNGQVTLTWTAPTSDGGSAITAYEVSSNNGTSWVTAASNTGHTFSGLTNGTQYTFKVRALNAAGEGDESTVSSTPFTVPGAVQNFHAEPGNEAVDLTWAAPLSNGGSAITSYQVSKDNGASWVTADSNAEHVFTGLTNSTEYTFAIRALNAAGSGAVSTAAATPEPGPPWHPLNFQAEPGDEQVVLTWEAPANDGGSVITKYEVSSDNGDNWEDVTSGTTYTFTGLTNGTVYTFKVRAVNEHGDGDESSVTSTPRTVPGAVTTFTATAGVAEVTLAWTAPSNNGGSVITGYQVSSNDGTNWVNASSNTGHTFSGLTNGTEYTFKVRAVNVAGHGAESTQTATTHRVPTVPQTFTAAPGHQQVTLSWTAPASDGGSLIIRYEISRDSGAWTNAGTGLTYTVTSLTNGTEYSFRVRAVNAAGAGAESEPQTAMPRTVPSAPQSFSATAGNAQVELAWTAPVNNGGAVITGYQVSSDNWATVVNKTPSELSHTFSDLTNFQEYTFRVRAVNVAGEGMAASTSATPIGPPEFVVTLSGGSYVITSALAPGYTTIQDALTHIRTIAEGDDVTIQFGDGTNVLDIGTEAAIFNNTGGTWGVITLTGSITSSRSTGNNAAIEVADVTIYSSANIASTSSAANGQGIEISSGTVNITGGTVQSNTGPAIRVNFSTLYISGGIITSSPTGGVGTINIGVNAKLNMTGGTVRTTSTFSGASAIRNSFSTDSDAIVISGGTVGAMDSNSVHGGNINTTAAMAIDNNNTGGITISGANTLITSANTDSDGGTIRLGNSSGGTLTVNSGTVRTTGTNAQRRSITGAGDDLASRVTLVIPPAVIQPAFVP